MPTIRVELIRPNWATDFKSVVSAISPSRQVPKEGVEPSRPKALVSKTSVSTIPPLWHYVGEGEIESPPIQGYGFTDRLN